MRPSEPLAPRPRRVAWEGCWSVDFGLLGPLLVRDGGRPVEVSAPRQRVLLATLLLSAGRVVSVDALAETLWDGRPPAGARGALHSGVQRLRAKLGPAGSGLIVTRAPGYVLQLGEGDFDVRRFRVLAARDLGRSSGGSAPAGSPLTPHIVMPEVCVMREPEPKTI